MYVEVVVDRPIVRYDRLPPGEGEIETSLEPAGADENPLAVTFHYHLPDELAGRVQPGQLVAVPFRSEQLLAVVIRLSQTSPVEATRPVTAILDSTPVLTPAQLELAYWLSAEYLTPLATCVKYFLPPGSSRQSEPVLKPDPAARSQTENLTARELALLTYLQRQGSARLAEVDASAARRLVEKGLVRPETALTRPRVGPKIDRMVELLIPADEIETVFTGLGRPSKQADLLLYLADLDDPLPPMAETLDKVGCSPAPAKTLAEKGWVELIPRQTRLAIPPHAGPAPDPGQAEEKILAYLQTQGRPALLEDILAATGVEPAALPPLLQAGRLVRLEEPPRITLTLPADQLSEAIIELRSAQKHAAVLNLLAVEDGPVWIGWVYAQTGATRQTLQDLAQAGLVSLDETRRWRDPLAGKSFTLATPPELTPEQQAVWREIGQNWQPGGPADRPVLLHGVTGSGKTEIYLRAIAAALAAGQGAIMLVPEISLAAQTVERVAARFPGQVAVWHSALSPGERYDTWERVRLGQRPIVVGPRSALFAPLSNLGVIIVDEEHEPAYKQRERAPLFHARDAALELGRLSRALVILGSATPDVVTYRKAERGEYYLLNLPYRVLAHVEHLAVQEALLKRKKQAAEKAAPGSDLSPALVALPLPQVEVVDMREELKAGNRTIFSRLLLEAIRQTLRRGEQVILFLNRRGTASFVICRDCGYVMRCPRCDTTLTYHAGSELMICHYCGYRRRPVVRCPECQGERIRYFGLGTERVEEAVKSLFPQAQTIRWDWDTTRQKGSHEVFLQHFVGGRANVMVGTQMVAKGLDLPLVTLVGVISADTALFLPDFRAAERTFQLLMQVAGRAGRSPLGGQVIIQSYNPEQVAIEAAANHDYEGFYATELVFRREQDYPPFKRLALLLYSGPGEERCAAEAKKLAERLRLHVARWGLPSVEIIGPTPDYVPRLRSQFRWHILLRAPDPPAVLRPLLPLPQGWRVDVDPVSLL